MTTIQAEPDAGAEAAARRRLALAVGPLMAPGGRIAIRIAAAALLGGTVASALGLASGSWPIGVLVGGLTAVLGFALAVLPLTDDDTRCAIELIADHDCHERALWTRDTGTNVPRRIPAMRSWLADHPDNRGRPTVLIGLGRLAEATKAIAAIVPNDAEEAFGLAVLRESALLYGGGAPDLDGLHAAWKALPEGREKRHRRACLALLEAQTAAVGGGDPLQIVAAARREVGEVHPSMRARRLVAKWAIAPAAAVMTGAAIASILLGR